MQEKIYLGGYTKRVSQGIYETVLDTDKETVAQPHLLIKNNGSTYIAWDDKHQRLFAITSQDGQGGVASYDLSGDTPRLINTVLAPGSSPAHVFYDGGRSLLYAANYHKGQVLVYSVAADGTLALVDTVQHEGHGPKPEQEAAHVHETILTPDNRLIACDLGMDQIDTFDISASGHLTHAATFTTPAGFGPRHIVFHPSAPIAYLLGELGSAVIVLAYDAAKGSFTQLEEKSLIPDDWTAFNGSAAIRVSQDGRFLYASNRGHNSIAVFSISPDGRKISLIQRISTEGRIPRDFNLDPTDRYVLAVNQDSDNGTLYRRDPESGFLTMIQKDIDTPESTCVLFV
ncbi:lactonase family protein [Schleiferilactobacillus harbinensis]|uniref:lactonase family protein n=1 Tax=Schleiferilactobacillus harbinensis TaxID=304207 RepID=UPI001238EBCF|nr:lactonase family protein [Schleiferilactobacillus harbinensis]QEU46054.1 lactonase family protein [Schleiferilactobacillus harbinensis]